jgi:hypothetical protein
VKAPALPSRAQLRLSSRALDLGCYRKATGCNALPQNLTEPALGNDIAAVLLPPQHDFEIAHSEGKIENDDGMYVQILAS